MEIAYIVSTTVIALAAILRLGRNAKKQPLHPTKGSGYLNQNLGTQPLEVLPFVFFLYTEAYLSIEIQLR